MYSNRQVEEKRFWASSLTFGDIHALIAKAEHSRQVLHDTLEDLELQERDLRATLRRTEAKVAQVRHHRKKSGGDDVDTVRCRIIAWVC